MAEFRNAQRLAFLFGTFFLSFVSLLNAQVGSASLSGVVSDPSGAAIPNAEVTLRSTRQNLTRTTRTASAGEYSIPALSPGTYELSVTGSGFVEQKTQPFELSSGQAGSMNITLQVAGQASTVTVQEAAPILQTTSASLGSVVTSTQVTELPLLGRSFLNAISLVPGTVPVPPAGSTTNHSPVGQSVMP